MSISSLAASGLLILTLGASSTPRSPTPKPDPVDTFIQGEMERRKIPGVALAVVRDGKVIKQAAYGLANVELSVPVKPETVFPLASTTKPFAASAVLLLVQDGKITLDDPVLQHLPQLPAAWKPVTIRHLLTHTSGLPDVAIKPGKPELIATSLDEALQKLAEMPVLAEPGARWAYNQTNYVLLGMLIEKVSGVPFQEFIQQRIFQRLGMSSTTFGDATEVVPGRASSYERSPSGALAHRDLVFPPYVRMAAGVNSNLPDLLRWNAALQAGTLLKPELLTQMWTAVKLADGSVFRLDKKTLGYGMGWVVNERPGHKSVGHSGGNSTAYARFLDDGVTVILLHNGNGNPDALLEGVAQRVIPALAEASAP